jgi:hypothetical protein
VWSFFYKIYFPPYHLINLGITSIILSPPNHNTTHIDTQMKTSNHAPFQQRPWLPWSEKKSSLLLFSYLQITKPTPCTHQKKRNKQGEKNFELPLLFHLQIDEVHDGMVRVFAKEHLWSIWNTKNQNDQTQKQKTWNQNLTTIDSSGFLNLIYYYFLSSCIHFIVYHLCAILTKLKTKIP